MKIINRLNDLEKVYNIVGRIDLDVWDFTDYESSQTALANTIASIRKDKYQNKDRIIVKHSTGDLYTPNSKVGLVLRNLQNELNQQDISNFL